jgi:hypothetical protein
MKKRIHRTIKGLAFLFILSVGLLVLPEADADSFRRPWSIFAYGGKWSDTRFVEVLGSQTQMQRSYIWVTGISRTICQRSENLSVEAELNVARHSRGQSHFEFNSAVNLRWHAFPWDDYLNTSLAYGLGPSYAVKHPEIEKRPERNSSRLLLFMLAELAFAPSEYRNIPWETFIRIHHRSAGFGAFSRAKGSNFITTGIRYHF